MSLYVLYVYCNMLINNANTNAASASLTVGQVLSRQNIEDVIKFAKRENLLILADEVRIYTAQCCLHEEGLRSKADEM